MAITLQQLQRLGKLSRQHQPRGSLVFIIEVDNYVAL
jgi:hypothetical protein